MAFLRFLYVFIIISVISIYDSIRVIVGLKLHGVKVFNNYAVNWARKLVKYMGIDLQVEGQENIVPGENYVYISNHSSMIDIPVTLYGINDNIRIIYKKELEKLPIFGIGLKLSPFIAVSRGDGKKSMESLNKANKAMQENMSILIFPEGTRSLDGQIGEFKRGAFILALRANKKIVPVTIIGTNKLLPKGSLKAHKGIVKLIIGKPIEINANMSKPQMLQFISSIREEICENIDKG
jgi:1-acyl-sn-glycerol-3-phosphate acyltransferase